MKNKHLTSFTVWNFFFASDDKDLRSFCKVSNNFFITAGSFLIPAVAMVTT